MTNMFLIGFGLGVLVTVAGAWLTIRRHLRRVRAAERRARAAERMAEIGSMTGGLAHEIKNPLSTIGLNAQLLAESVQDLDVPDAQKAPLLSRTRTLKRETERLAGTLADFLQFAGEIRLDRAPTDLSVLAGELVDFFTPEAERHAVRVRTELASGSGGGGAPIIAHIDARAVKQAVLNLMLNATQAMAAQPPLPSSAPPRELIIRTERRREPSLGSKGGRSTDTGVIHVIDTGPGMPPETLARIFNPYFTTKAGGSGLGLPTSRRLIEAHDGRIDVHSEPNRGSDFSVVLPLAPG